MPVVPRILIVSSEFPPGPGGIGTHAWQLARQLTRRGWDVSVLACQDYVSDAEIRDWCATQPFSVQRLPSGQGAVRSLLRRRGLLRHCLVEQSPDIVVASGLKSLWLIASLRELRIPWVAVGHGSEFTTPSAWQRWLTRRSLAAADRVVCVSEFTRDLAIRAGAPPEATQVILNGADPEDFFVATENVAATRRLLDANAGHVLLTVGHVSERKAHDVVIRALPRILRQFPDTHYAIAGIPALQNQLTQLADSLGVAQRIHFVGRQTVTQLRDWFNACDLFVLTSRTTATGDCEGFGIVAVEAALCGKPSVVTRGTGLAEAVIDGVTGVTVPQEDPEATAEAVCRLLADRELRMAMGTSAAQRARQELTWDKRVSEYDRLFSELVERPDGGRLAVTTAGEKHRA